MAVLHGDRLALHVALRRADLFQRLFGCAQLRGRRCQRSLLFVHPVFEPQQFGIQRPQFALHAKRPRLARTPAGDHTALIARPVRRDERVLRILPRQFFRGRRAVGQIRRAQPRQELFGRRA